MNGEPPWRMNAFGGRLVSSFSHHQTLNPRMLLHQARAAAPKTEGRAGEVPVVGDVLELTCESLAFGGKGVCKLPG